jgi:hypothetical protein
MEFFLHFWDELDDAAGACRHIATALLAGSVTFFDLYRRLLRMG